MNFLPGWHPGFIASARAPVTTLTQAASATSTAGTITVPADVRYGDLLVLHDRATNSAGHGIPSTVLPLGFTAIANSSITSGPETRQIISYKIAAGSEAGTSITGMDGTGFDRKLLYVFRSDSTIESVVASTPNSEATDGNPAAQVVAASGGTPPLVVIGSYGTGGFTLDPRSFTPAKDGEITPGTGDNYLAYKIYNSSPANVTIDMDDEGARNILQSCYLSVS